MPLAENEQSFVPHACWALRRGRPYWVTDATLTPACQHVAALDGLAAYGCLPTVAQGETFGVLHVRFEHAPAGSEAAPDGALTAQRRVSESLAEHLSLSLSNLRLREKLRDQSIRDPLTGLFNRRYLEESLEREVARARRRQLPLSVLMLDLDHFKSFNDNFGHEAGDLLLREFGHYLRRHCRDEDIACRFGGEEVVVMLSDVGAAQARLRAEALREGVKGLFVELRGQPLGTVSISIGIATFPEDGPNIEAVVRLATPPSTAPKTTAAIGFRSAKRPTHRVMRP